MRFGLLVPLSYALASIGLLTVAPAKAERRPIDSAHSTLTVFVYKSGLFSAFADNHVVNAPIAGGTISEEAPREIELVVRTADLRVLDPDLAPERRAEVQARMLGSEVLDAAQFPEITFASTTIEPAGADRWNVSGRLNIHGRTRIITFPVVLLNGKYSGQVRIRQRDFGIEPIRVAGGTVRVKDELKIQFEIAK
jgi:polyisoprenoid-binding protein YceI